MKINILGLGDSIKEYKHDGSITIGLNDIDKYFHPDYICVIDPPRRFSEERLKTIINSKATMLTDLPEWVPLKVSIQLFKRAGERGSVKEIDGNEILWSNNSAFTAVHLAYKMGAKTIVMFGVDINNHPTLNRDGNIQRVFEDFKKLKTALNVRGVGLFVGNNISSLKSILPIYH